MKQLDPVEKLRLEEQGRKIRELREEKGLSQAKLANIMELTTTSIQNYEAGRNDVVGKNRTKLALALSQDNTEFLSSPIGEVRENHAQYQVSPRPNIKKVVSHLTKISKDKDLSEEQYQILASIVKVIEK